MNTLDEEEAKNHGAAHLRELFAVYPIHIKRFLSRFGVTTLEMTELLGLPSVQEWYRIKKNENERVRNTVVCSLLRAYTENPQWLLSRKLEFKDVAVRLYWVLRNEGYRRRQSIIYAICQTFDKSQHVLRTWYTGESTPDQASTRLIELMMQLDDKDLYELVCDARLSAIAQVMGKDVSVYVLPDGERRYVINGDGTLYTLEEVAHKAPLPGSRRTNKDYAEGGKPKYMNEIKADIGDNDAHESVRKASGMRHHLPWIQN